MPNATKARVLDELRPYLRLLTAFNRDHFRHSDWHSILHSALYAFGAAMILIGMPIYNALLAWHLFDNGFEWTLCVVGLPLMATIIQFEMTFISMMLKNQAITESIELLQRAVDQRK